MWVMFPHLVETVLQIAADLVPCVHTRNHHWGADVESMVRLVATRSTFRLHVVGTIGDFLEYVFGRTTDITSKRVKGHIIT